MSSTFTHFEIPSTAAPEVAELAGGVLTDLTLIELAGDGLRRLEAQRRPAVANLRRNRTRRERLARRDAQLDQLAALREEMLSLHIDAELGRGDTDGMPPSPRRDPAPPPPLDRRASDHALAMLEAWWMTCVPLLVADARAQATELAEHLRAHAPEVAERLDRFAAADLGALSS